MKGSAALLLAPSLLTGQKVTAEDQDVVTKGSTQVSSRSTCMLGFSTYGMKTMPTETAIQTVADIGFDSIELAVREGWDADSAKLSPARRQSITSQIDANGLTLTSLMEHVFPTDSKRQAVAIERLKLASELAHDLSESAPPLIQTVLGGGDFDSIKTELRDRLGEWVEIANSTETTIAIKPHRGGAVSKPSDAVWLIEQLGKPARLRMVYDYSHYAYRDLDLAETIQTALPFVSHVAVKDAVKESDRVVFKLPGSTGAIDFVSMIRQLHAGGYRGDFNCEVSGMVSGKPGYDATGAAKTCYKNMAAAFDRSGIQRPSS